jgi:Uma2 family endonuclease
VLAKRAERLSNRARVTHRERRAILGEVLDPREISPEVPRPVRRVEYERLVESGFFEGERVELLDGVIVAMSPHGPDHDAALGRVAEILMRVLAGRATVRIQSGFAASDGSEPEPDVAVVPPGDYDAHHPSAAWLIIEVAQSSLPKDMGPKARLYAQAGVEEYWVVDLIDGAIAVHAEPRAGFYAHVKRVRRGEDIALRHFSDVHVAVSTVVKG